MRILIGIITAHHASRKAYRVKARKTWLKDCAFDHVYVYGEHPANDADDILDGIWFPVPDDREHMVLKNQALFRYALRAGYDFCFRICDDTVVSVERLLRASEMLARYDYAGAMTAKFRFGPHHVPIRYLDYMNGGCGIWLSRKAMEMLVADEWKGPKRPIPPNIDFGFGFHMTMDDWDWDDRWIGEVLKGNLAWDDPKRISPYLAYALNGIEVHEDELMFYHDDETIRITVHDPGKKKTGSFITPVQVGK